MENIAVIYKSKYGATKQYAEWIAQETGAVLLEASAVKPSQLASFDAVIYGGGIYADAINGIELVTKNPCKSLTVFTVGLTDPEKEDYSDVLEKNFSKEFLSKVKIFHLRGGIDYQKLGIIHKGLVSMISKTLMKKDESTLTQREKDMMKAYGSKVDFTEKNAIIPILEHIKG